MLKISHKSPKPRLATYAEFYDGENLLDEGLILFFPNPKSFTGEDVIELQAHGGPVILNMLLKQLLNKEPEQALPESFHKERFWTEKFDLVQTKPLPI